MALHEWAFASSERTTAPEVEYANLWSKNVGAFIMGREHVRPDPRRLGRRALERLVGRRSAVPHPVFVLTHHAREPVEMQGGTTFHFVTDGIEAALERATDAAGGPRRLDRRRRVDHPQYLRAGLVDELQLHVTPVLLGTGERLFDDLGDALDGYECVELVSTPAVAHFTFGRKHG